MPTDERLVANTVRNRLKLLLSSSARKAEILRGTGLVASAPDRHASGMTRTQEMFLQWNADRLGISLEDSKQRYAESRAVFPGGHLGRAFERFNDEFHSLFRVFFDDTPAEVFETYRFLGPLHFLTFLTYPEPNWSTSDLIVQQLQQRGTRASIMDFGCGLAHQSRTLAEFLRDKGFQVTLTLADVQTLRADFLTWWGVKTEIPTTFLPCTESTPIPPLPEFDICFTTEFFEHVHDPVPYFENIDNKLAHGGLLVTGVMDHHAGFLHVSPQLERLRHEIHSRGYTELVSNTIFRRV
jgi:SAM-dependent methyltransferase